MTWNVIVGTLIAIALLLLLWRRYVVSKARQREEPARFFGSSLSILQDVRFEEQGSGYPRVIGRYKDLPVQIHPVVDTLATRRLPALWLLVTVQDRLPVKAKFDMMMRPAGPTTFSNFDMLPSTIPHPVGFPLEAVIKTDDPSSLLPPHVVAPHLEPFLGPRAKELLITPNGLRLVWLMAEADRARYGVLRQAAFDDPVLETNLLRDLLDRLLALRQDIIERDRQAA